MHTLATGILGLALGLLSPSLAGQSQTLFFEDFEDGITGWTETAFGGLWHAATDGECGAVSKMAACNLGPAACDYDTAYPSSATLIRLDRPITLLNEPATYVVDFDYRRGVDATGDLTTVWLGGDEDFWMWLAGYVSGDLADTETLAHHTSAFTPGEFFWGGVTLELELQVDKVGNQGLGWMVDNLRISTNAFAKLHGAKGEPPPELEAIGALRAGEGHNILTLSNAEPAAQARLVVGFTELSVPFKGGVLVPDPVAALPFTTDATGSLSVDFAVPAGIQPGLSVYFQVWITDLDETFRLAASNGVMGVTS